MKINLLILLVTILLTSCNDESKNKPSPVHDNQKDMSNPKTLIGYYIQSAKDVAVEAKNEHAKKIVDFFLKHYFLATPSAICNRDLPSIEGRYLAVAAIADSTECAELHFTSMHSNAFYDLFKQSIIVKTNEYWNPILTGIVFLHEVNHAYQFYNSLTKNLHTNLDDTALVRSEVETYEFCRELYRDLYGNKYDQLVDKRINEMIRLVQVEKKPYDLFSNLKPYEQELCLMFKCLTEKDSDIVKSEFVIQTNLSSIERLWPKEEWYDMKIKVMLGLHQDNGFFK